jgi:hypothetical protein
MFHKCAAIDRVFSAPFRRLCDQKGNQWVENEVHQRVCGHLGVENRRMPVSEAKMVCAVSLLIPFSRNLEQADKQVSDEMRHQILMLEAVQINQV